MIFEIYCTSKGRFENGNGLLNLWTLKSYTLYKYGIFQCINTIVGKELKKHPLNCAQPIH